MSLSERRLEESVAKLVGRPGHENVRVELGRLIIDGLGADTSQVHFEQPVPEVSGRIDALLGSTLFEIKSNLGKERDDAIAQLRRYMGDRERETGRSFVGVITDGAEFAAFLLDDGEPRQVSTFRPSVDQPRALLAWLESVVVLGDDLTPDVPTFRREVGRESVAYARALRDIRGFWSDVAADQGVASDARLKRDLWNRLLRVAYGADVADPDLFFQHTYLVVLAKAIATSAIIGTVPEDPQALLDGQDFRAQGISGAVESDFFDWLLLHPEGGALVRKIAHHVTRFDLSSIDTDILKGLYESLIDPTQRHDLGEYYTPDWLAARICQKAIHQPLTQRVLDPACGSGTFLFQAVRLMIAAAKKAGTAPDVTAAGVADRVAGIDVHPVAVIFARVTFILAYMPILEHRPDNFSVPVYLGDALQWNVQSFMGSGDLEIVVPAEDEAAIAIRQGKLPDAPASNRMVLRFPLSVARSPGDFDRLVAEMLRLSEADAPTEQAEASMTAVGVTNGSDLKTLKKTYKSLRDLQRQGRNHIWGYVARNLSRPIWLSGESRKADVIVGNPPWVAYNRMVSTTQATFKARMEEAGLWGGTTTVAAFDLCAYFFARALHLYGRRDAEIAFVLPYAAMYKKPYAKLRGGTYVMGAGKEYFAFTGGWTLRSDVQPLFPRPSCVIFAKRTAVATGARPRVTAFSGQLPRRDAVPAEASEALIETDVPWPADDPKDGGSEYRERFRQGAILVPRRFALVVRPTGVGRVRASVTSPSVEGRTGRLDKAPWLTVTPPKGQVEANFIKPVLLGENIAPFKIIDEVEGVIPYDEKLGGIMDSAAARARGFDKLAAWLDGIERTFKRVRQEAGKGDRTFAEQLNWIGQLSSQFPIKAVRVVYAKAGNHPAATVVQGEQVIDHKLYWASAANVAEARFLTAILNSDTVRSRAEQWQAEGLFGAQDFDKGAWNLPIPLFDRKDALHVQLADLCHEAEKVARKVPKGAEGFQRHRRNVRDALNADGIQGRLETAVEQLLDRVAGDVA
jgi:hypothetical protein